ncbi:MAG: rhodanese-like domain-containing protein [Verrucomicrobiae bacterium]|nr:rhodanese-like domain-containing protein [Verrucomicrobiae bacterium]
MRSLLLQILSLLAISAVVAVATAWWHPRAPAWYLTAPADDRWDLAVAQVPSLGPEVLWIDARKDEDFEKGHLDGAVSLNEENWGDRLFDLQDRLQEAMGKPVVVYCDGSGCERSRHVAERLRELFGMEPVYVLKGDWRDVEPR